MVVGSEIYTQQSIEMHDSKYIILPVWKRGEKSYGNLSNPNPHARSSVGDTSQLYPHGTKFVDGERTFFYGYIGAVDTANKANLGVFNMNEAESITWGATAGVAEDTKVGILASGLTDATPSEDDFAGGWLLPRTNPYSSYRVLASSLVDNTVVGEVDLWIDYGLIEAVTLSQGSCFLNKSEYKNLAQHWGHGVEYATCPGVTLIDPIAETWQWIQAWGPCYVVPMNDEIGALHNQDCVFHNDGSIKVETRASGAFRQRAGYMLNSASISNTATWLIKLQIDR